MKFFIDSALSPIVAERLREAGYDAVHTRDYDMTSASDSSILERAAAEQRVVVSADTDFGTQLAESGHALPSVLPFRRGVTRRPDGQAELLLANLPSLAGELIRGSLIVIEHNRIRVRPLPILG